MLGTRLVADTMTHQLFTLSQLGILPHGVVRKHATLRSQRGAPPATERLSSRRARACFMSVVYVVLGNTTAPVVEPALTVIVVNELHSRRIIARLRCCRVSSER